MSSWKDGLRVYRIDKFCIDCRKKIGPQAIRCLSCANKINCMKSSRMKNKKHSLKTIEKCRKATIFYNGFKGKKHKRSSVIKMMKSQRKSFWNKQNNCEIKVEFILNKLFPNTYKFVGNGKFIIDGFCPDFLNIKGKKQLIEFFGDYWHNKPKVKLRDLDRLKSYEKFGYKTLIIWEYELQNIALLEDKIKNFEGY